MVWPRFTSAWRLASLLLTMEAGAAQRSAYPDSCTDPHKRATDPQCSLLFPGDGLNGFGDPEDEPSDSLAWRKGKLALGGDYWWRETADGDPEISLTNPFDEWKVGRLEDSGREYFWRERDSEEGFRTWRSEPVHNFLRDAALASDTIAHSDAIFEIQRDAGCYAIFDSQAAQRPLVERRVLLVVAHAGASLSQHNPQTLQRITDEH